MPSLDRYTADVITSSKKVREEDPGIKDVFGMFTAAKDPDSKDGEVLGLELVRLNSATFIIAGGFFSFLLPDLSWLVHCLWKGFEVGG